MSQCITRKDFFRCLRTGRLPCHEEPEPESILRELPPEFSGALFEEEARRLGLSTRPEDRAATVAAMLQAMG